MGDAVKIRKLAAVLAVMTASVLGVAPVASAAESDGLDYLRDYWTQHGVPAETQDTLVEDYLDGNLPDSMTGVEPTGSETVETLEEVVTVFTYPDGSVSHQSVQAEEQSGGISTRGITGCKDSAGSGYVHYSGCVVSAGNGDFYLKFKVSYDKYSTGCAAITSSGSAEPSSPGGSMTDPVRTVNRKQSTKAQQAVVKYHSVYTSALNGNDQDVYLGFWLTCAGKRSISTS